MPSGDEAVRDGRVEHIISGDAKLVEECSSIPSTVMEHLDVSGVFKDCLQRFGPSFADEWGVLV